MYRRKKYSQKLYLLWLHKILASWRLQATKPARALTTKQRQTPSWKFFPVWRVRSSNCARKNGKLLTKVLELTSSAARVTANHCLCRKLKKSRKATQIERHLCSGHAWSASARVMRLSLTKYPSCQKELRSGMWRKSKLNSKSSWLPSRTNLRKAKAL